jgi:hypothetical protein
MNACFVQEGISRRVPLDYNLYMTVWLLKRKSMVEETAVSKNKAYLLLNHYAFKVQLVIELYFFRFYNINIYFTFI